MFYYLKLTVKEGFFLYQKIVTAFLLLGLLSPFLFTSCSRTEGTDPANTDVAQPAEAQESASPNEMDGEFYLGETVFIGDSRTNGLLTYRYLPPEQVFAIDGSTQKSIREQEFIQLEPNGPFLSVEEAVKERQPHRILIAFGVNAIPLMSEEEFMKEFEILIDELTSASPDSKIVIQSILPVSWWKHETMQYLTNENIDHFNDLLKQYCTENSYTFFDVSDEFKGEDGSLDPQYDAGDGLHFNQSFYQKYIQLLVEQHP